MFGEIGYSAALVSVGYLSAGDIREKKLSLKVLLVSLAAAVFAFMLCNRMSDEPLMKEILIEELIIRMFPGMLLLLLALLTKERIGYGDGITVLLIGLWCGGVFAAAAVCIALFLSGFYALVLLIRRTGHTLPFLPFLLIAMEVLIGFG